MFWSKAALEPNTNLCYTYLSQKKKFYQYLEPKNSLVWPFFLSHIYWFNMWNIKFVGLYTQFLTIFRNAFISCHGTFECEKLLKCPGVWHAARPAGLPCHSASGKYKQNRTRKKLPQAAKRLDQKRYCLIYRKYPVFLGQYDLCWNLFAGPKRGRPTTGFSIFFT